MMDQNSCNCPNCAHPMAEGDRFCAGCGQRYTTGKVPFIRLVGEFFESVLNLDSKIFRTLGMLFIPGKLTVEYFKGRHQRYFAPLRLFFVLTLLFLAVVNFLTSEPIHRELMKLRRDQDEIFYRSRFLDQLDSARQELRAMYPRNRQVREALDSLGRKFEDQRQDSIEVPRIGWIEDSTEALMVAVRDLEQGADSREIARKYGLNHWLDQLIFQQEIKVILDPTSFSQAVLGKASWMILLMMPVLALLLKLLYIRRQRYYVEHLVFSFHYHAFAFLVLSVGLLFESGILMGILILLILLYLYLAMRRVYGQGWIKTFIKFNVLNFTYVIIFSLFLVGTFIVSAALF